MLCINSCLCCFLKPSRELAEQTYEQIKKFKKYLDNPKINELLVIGGVNVKEQINALQNQGVNIVVGTPGRLEDLIQGGKLKIYSFVQCHLVLTVIVFCRLFIIEE